MENIVLSMERFVRYRQTELYHYMSCCPLRSSSGKSLVVQISPYSIKPLVMDKFWLLGIDLDAEKPGLLTFRDVDKVTVMMSYFLSLKKHKAVQEVLYLVNIFLANHRRSSAIILFFFLGREPSVLPFI